MEVTGQFHAPAALLTGKEPLISVIEAAGPEPRAGLDVAEKRKISCLPIIAHYSFLFLFCIVSPILLKTWMYPQVLVKAPDIKFH
jgi:hypothetical protein